MGKRDSHQHPVEVVLEDAGRRNHAVRSQTQQAAIDFAIFLAKRLERARVQHEAEHLVLVSPPDFLGLMRKSLNADTRRMVVLELDRNFVKLPPKELHERLAGELEELPVFRA